MAAALPPNGEQFPGRSLSLSESPGPVLLDYSYTGMVTLDLEEALVNQPTKIFNSIGTLLATNNALLQVPNTIIHYKNLRTLDLSSNQLTSLPDSLTECSNLVSLNVRCNFLDDKSFPKHFGKLAQLTELNLSGNQLKKIPKEILDLGASLTNLHLGANRITDIRSEILLLRKLEVFYLGGNELLELPQEVGYLTNLKVLVLCENQLQCLPSTVCNLKQLKSLLLHRNKLTSLPVELIKLRNLMEVRFLQDILIIL